MIGKKRLALAAGTITAVAAAGSLIAGTTFGFFSATNPTQNNTFSAGTVSFGTPGGTACAVTFAQPGDSGTCTLAETYNGTVSSGAYLALDVSITGSAGTPQQAYAPGNVGTTPTAANGLYDGTANGLQVTIDDSQGTAVTYMNGTTLNGSATTSGSASASAVDLLVNKTAFTSTTTITWTVHWSIPTTANNAYDGSSSSIKLLVHAVQAGHNGSTSTCTAGLQCDTSVAAGDPAWS